VRVYGRYPAGERGEVGGPATQEIAGHARAGSSVAAPLCNRGRQWRLLSNGRSGRADGRGEADARGPAEAMRFGRPRVNGGV
jgi:hypothetical protein